MPEAHSEKDRKDVEFVQVWDLPTRLFKWLLVLLVILAWVSDKYGGAVPMWHKANGYAILVLIVFRILWGFAGGSTVRFGAFAAGPKAVLSYAAALLKGKKPFYLGHNPLGGWMIMALLAALGLQAILGLYAADEDRLVIEGPLAKTISDAAVDRAAHFHRLGFDLIVCLAAIHIAANVFYDLVKRSGLIRAMISGRKPKAAYIDQPEAIAAGRGRAPLCLIAACMLVFGGIVLLGGNPLNRLLKFMRHVDSDVRTFVLGQPDDF
jgi:cytochrome b